jgi:putative peptidoglycan lipid II flippase
VTIPVPDSPPPAQTLVRPIVAVTAATAGVHLATLLVQVVMARLFGAGADLDAFFAAYALPQYAAAIVTGALAQVCVPLLVGAAEQRGEDAARRAAGAIVAVVALGMLALTAAGIAFAGPLLRLSAPGLPPAVHARATLVARILWPTALGGAAVAVATSIESARQRFLWPALVPFAAGLLNLGLLLALAKQFGVTGAAVATTAAALAQLLLFAPAFARGGAWPRGADVRELGALLWPLLAAGIFVRITIVGERFFGSQLPAGSIADIAYASRFIGPLSLLLATGLATVLFPRMAAHVANAKLGDLGDDFSASLRTLWAVIAPAMLIGIALSRPLVGALFEGGRFTAADTDRVAALLRIFLLGLAASSLGMVTGRVLYALNAARLVAWMAVVESAAYVAYTAWLTRRLGAAGVAWGFVIYVTTSLAWHLPVIARKIRWRGAGATAWSAARTTLAAIAAAIVASFAGRIGGAWIGFLAGSAISVAAFIVLMIVVNRDDARLFTAALRGLWR